MKFFILSVALFALVLAAPPHDADSEKGPLRSVDSEEGPIPVNDTLSFEADNGQTLVINFLVDENGFRPRIGPINSIKHRHTIRISGRSKKRMK